MNEVQLPKDFVQTQKSIQRLEIIMEKTRAGIPVLLNGPTGTGKTYSAKIALGDAIIFNCSQETTVDQLIGKVILQSTGSEITKFEEGPYTLAYKEGHSIILDELNLASEEILQFLEASLDLDFLVIETNNGNPLKIKRHKNFKLVATQNPAEDDYIKNRNRLSEKFLSKFSIINFDPFDSDELRIIAQSKLIDNETTQKFLEFHDSCKIEESNSYRMFTVRDIKSTINNVSDQISLPLSIYLTYIAGFPSSERSKLEDILKIIFGIDSIPQIPKVDFDSSNYFKNHTLTNALSISNLLCIQQAKPLLIVGEVNSGKTTLAKLISKNFHPKRSFPRTVICTPETTISDLIGKYTIESHKSKGLEPTIPLRWIDGPVVTSILNGDVLLLDNISNIQSQVIERLNTLIDSSYAQGSEFMINERPEKQKININPNFRIIATASYETIKQMSPALINRFSIVYLDNQFQSNNEDSQNFFDYINKRVPDSDSLLKLLNLDFNYSNKFVKIIECANSFDKLHHIYPNIPTHDVIQFLINVLIGDEYATISDIFVDEVISKIKNDSPTFHFSESRKLRKFIATLVCLYYIGKHVVVQSQTGYGKTSAAEALGYLLDKRVIKVSFNSETQIGELFGNAIVTGGGFQVKKGPIAEAISCGCLFIADELNLAELNVLKSLRMAIDCNGGDELELPNNEGTTKVHDNYFFIGCQNDISMFGRKRLPVELTSKIVMIEYPLLDEEDLQGVLKSIISEMSDNIADINLMDYLQNISTLMIGIRKSELLKSKPWSFREVRRFLRRNISFRNNETLTPHHHAAFQLLSVHDDEKLEEIIRVVSIAFDLSPEQAQLLNKDMRSEVQVEFIDNSPNCILRKGTIEIIAPKPDVEINIELIQFWDSYFNMKIIDSQEPILLVGPSGYKEFIAKHTSYNPKCVALNKDSTTSSLIGNIVLTDRKTVIASLMDIISRIGNNVKIFDRANTIKKNIFAKKFEISEFESLINDLMQISSMHNIIEQIKKNILEAIQQENDETTFLSYYTTEFTPGLITSAILQQNTLILKNFSHPSVAVTERLNELFAINPELTLNEDFTNTIIPSNNPTIKITSDKFRVIATCTVDEKNKLSDAMLSRMTIVRTKEYKTENFKYILNENYNEFITDPESNYSTNQKIVINRLCERISKIELDISPFTIFSMALYCYNIISLKPICGPLQTPLVFKDGKVTCQNLFSIPDMRTENKKGMVFTESIQKMTESLFISAVVKYPTVVQGVNGVGKSRVIKYLASVFNADVLTITISNSTTVENIFGHNELSQTENGTSFGFKPSAFLDKITNNSNTGRPIWIVFEELNQASNSLLESLAQVFDPESNTLALPNGDVVQKAEYMVFGLTSKQLINDTIMKQAIVYKQEDYQEKEFVTICQEIADNKNLKNAIRDFSQALYKLKIQQKDNKSQIPITIRTFKLYLKLIKSLPNYTKLIQSKFLNISMDKDDSDIKIGIESNKMIINGRRFGYHIDDIRTKCLVQNLTPSQKELFLILNSIITQPIPLIVQGKTASGKSHSVHLFAEASGKELTVLQLNADTSDSIIFGGYRPLSELKPKQRSEILNEIKQINPDIHITGWTPSALKAICKKLELELDSHGEQDQKKINNLIRRIVNDCQFYNMIEKYDSVIVSAMRSGKWLLLDGIEACPSYIFDRIISLLSPKPKLNLYEHGSNNIIEAHKDFRIIMTYNPFDALHKGNISQSILSRCFVYNLHQIDESFISSYIVLYGQLVCSERNTFGSEDEMVQTVAKISNLHSLQKESKFGEFTIIDGRTLIKLAKSLISFSPLNEEKILKSLYSNYGRGISIEDDHKSEITNQYNSQVDEKLMKQIPTKSIVKSTEIKNLIESLQNFKISQSLNIEFILSHLNTIEFREFEQLKPVVNEIMNNKQIHVKIFYRDVINLISDFINFITSNNEEILKNKTVESVNPNEFPPIDLFKSRSEAIIYLLQNQKFNFEVKFSAFDLRLIGELVLENTLNKLISILIISPTIGLDFFKKGTFFAKVVEYFIKLRSYGRIRMIKSGDEIPNDGVAFEFENNELKKIHYNSKQYDSLLDALTQLVGYEKCEENELEDDYINYESIFNDEFYIIYASIFNDSRSMKGIIKDFYSDAFNISYVIILKQNYKLLVEWIKIWGYIIIVLKKNKISLTSEFWSKYATVHPQIITAIIDFNLKQFQNAPILSDFQSRLEKINLEIGDSENSSIQRRKLQLQQIKEYINKKEPHYEVLKWFFDEGIFSTKISSNILKNMINLAKNEIYLPKKYDINEFGNLFIDITNNEQTDWFFYIAKYSYIIYLINQLKKTNSLYAIRELMKLFKQLKSKFIGLLKLDQEVLSEIQQSSLRELFEGLSSYPELFDTEQLSNKFDCMIELQKATSSNWKNTIEKVLEIVPPSIPILYPPLNDHTIQLFIEYVPKIFKGDQDLPNLQKLIKSNPPTSFEMLSEIIEDNFDEDELKLLKSICDNRNTIPQIREFDLELYKAQRNEYLPLQSLLINRCKEIESFMDIQNHEITVGFIILRLYSNLTLVQINEKGNNNDIDNFLSPLYKSASYLLFQIMQIAKDYNIDDIFNKDNWNIELDMHSLLDLSKTCKSQMPYFYQGIVQSKTEDIKILVLDQIPDFIILALKRIRDLFDFIKNFNGEHDNLGSTLMSGCFSTIQHLMKNEKYQPLSEFVGQFFTYIVRNFDIEIINDLCNSPKSDEQIKLKQLFSTIFWDPIGAFDYYSRNECNKKLQKLEQITTKSKELLETINKLDFASKLKTSMENDRNQFMNRHNENKIDQNIMQEWKEYSSLILSFYNSLPSIENIESFGEFDFNIAELEKLINYKIEYANSVPIEFIFIVKKDKEQKVFEFIDNEYNKHKIKYEQDIIAIHDLGDDYTIDENYYEIKNIEIYVCNNTTQCEKFDLNHFANICNKLQESLKNNQEIIPNTRFLKVLFGSKGSDQFNNFLEKFDHKYNNNEFISEIKQFGKPKFDFDKNANLDKTSSLFKEIMQYTHTIEELLANIDKNHEDIEKYKSMLTIEIKRSNFSYPQQLNHSVSIDMQKINHDNLYMPIIIAENDNIQCSFNDIEISLKNLSPIELSPFTFTIPVVGHIEKSQVNLQQGKENYFDFDFEKDRIILKVKISSLPKFISEIEAKLLVYQISIPIRIKFSYRNVKLYIKSENNTFINDKVHECFMIDKQVMFKDEKISIIITDEEGTPVEHSLSFTKYTGSKQIDPPILNYNNCVSQLSFSRPTDVNMRINADFESFSEQKISMKTELIERYTSLKLYNFNNSEFDDNNYTYAGDLPCVYYVLFSTYNEFDEDELTIKFSSNSSDIEITVVNDDDSLNPSLYKSQIKGNKIEKIITFNMHFLSKQSNSSEIRIEASLAKGNSYIEKEFTIHPCYIEYNYNKYYINIPSKNNHPPKPNLSLKLIDLQTNKESSINENQRIQQRKFCIISPFSYFEHSNNLINIDYDKNTKQFIKPDKNNHIEYFVIQKNNSYNIKSPKEIDQNSQIICGRICSSDNKHHKYEINDLFKECWFPFTTDFGEIEKRIKSHNNIKNLLYSLITFVGLRTDDVFKELNNGQEDNNKRIQIVINIFKSKLENIQANGNNFFKPFDIKRAIELAQSIVTPPVEIFNNKNLKEIDDRFKSAIVGKIIGFPLDKQFKTIKTILSNSNQIYDVEFMECLDAFMNWESKDEIKDFIKEIVENSNIQMLNRVVAENSKESSFKYIYIDESEIKGTDQFMPQKLDHILIKSTRNESVSCNNAQLAVIPEEETLANIDIILENSYQLCMNLPLYLLSLIESKAPIDDANKIYNYLDTINNWINKIDNNNPFKPKTDKFKKYFELMRKILFDKSRSSFENYILPRTVQPKSKNIWSMDDTIIFCETVEIEETIEVSSNETVEKAKVQLNKEIETKETGDGIKTRVVSELQTDEVQRWILDKMSNPSDDIKVHFSNNILRDYSNPNIMENTTLSVLPIIEESIQLAQNIVKLASEKMEIFDNSDAVILLDSSSTITETQRAPFFTLFTAMAYALDMLHVPTTLIVFCDNGFQFLAKGKNSELKPYHIQMALDAFSVYRRLSDLCDALDKTKQIPMEKNKKRTIYVISDGLFYNLHDVNSYASLFNNQDVVVSLILQTLIEDSDKQQLISYVSRNLRRIKYQYGFYEDLNSIFNDSTKVAELIVNSYNPILIGKEENQQIKVQRYTDYGSVDFKLDEINSDNDEFYSASIESLLQESEGFPSIRFSSDDIFITSSNNSQKLPINIFKNIKLNQSKIVSAFEPNKPTQFSQSTKGSNISLKGFIQFYITQGQDQRIYLEKNSGFILSHSLFVVIDASESCFNQFTANSSYQTIVSTLLSLKNADFDSVSIFITKGSNIYQICHECSSLNAFDENSEIWGAIYSLCFNPELKSDITGAMNAVYELRSKQNSKSSICLCFTDALISKKELGKVGTLITMLEQRNTPVFGIGIGFNPINIKMAFKFPIISSNPFNIPVAISQSLRGQFKPDVEVKPFESKDSNTDLVKVIYNIIHNDTKNPVFRDIFNMLNNIQRSEETNSIYYNQNIRSIQTDNSKNSNTGMYRYDNYGLTNIPGGYEYSNVQKSTATTTIQTKEGPKNENDEVFDLGRGKIWNQNILICQFWDYCMMKANTIGESEHITRKSLESRDGIIASLAVLGIKCVIVQNYQTAIQHLQSGRFSQAWIICGRGEDRKPDEPYEGGSSKYIDLFIDVLIEFQKRGGSLLFSADNNPLTYELNKFLEKVNLEGEKIKFRFSTDEKGGQMLRFGNIDGEEAKIFDERSYIDVPGSKRPLYGFNVKTLYEGTTISCVPGDADLGPFQPFIVTTNGNYSNLYYMSPPESLAGDIILDGSFTRFFNELHKEGTLRFVRNIAVWLLSVEKRERLLRSYKLATSWKVDKFNIDFPSTPPSVKFNQYVDGSVIDICFAVDATGSMRNLPGQSGLALRETTSSMINGAKNISKTLIKYIDDKYSNCDVQFSAVFFRDLAMARYVGHINKNRADTIRFKPSRSFNPDSFDYISCGGGANDGPEDWVQAFDGVLEMDWRPRSKKILIMITDASCHGTSFDSKVNKKYNDRKIDIEEEPKMLERIKSIAQKGIDVCFFYTHDHAFKAVRAFEMYFRMYGGKDFRTMYEQFNNSGKILKSQVTTMLQNIIDDAVSSFNVGKVQETYSTTTVLRKQRSQRREIRTKLLDNHDNFEYYQPKPINTPKFEKQNETKQFCSKQQKKKQRKQEKEAQLELQNAQKKNATQKERLDENDDDFNDN